MKKTATALVITAFTLTACSSTENLKASGLLDEVKSAKAVKAVTKPATRTVVDYRNDCQTKFRTVTKSSGTGTKRRTWTEQQSYQDCNKVRTGTHQERYTKTIKPGKPAMYCVELDNVNGNKDRDDVLFQVNHATYLKWVGANEGAKVTDMRYLREVATCRN